MPSILRKYNYFGLKVGEREIKYVPVNSVVIVSNTHRFSCIIS